MYQIIIYKCSHAVATCELPHYNDAQWALWRLKSPIIRLFVSQFRQAKSKHIFASLVLCDANTWWYLESPGKGPLKRNAFPCLSVIMFVVLYQQSSVGGPCCNVKRSVVHRTLYDHQVHIPRMCYMIRGFSNEKCASNARHCYKNICMMFIKGFT